jgi:hypothetical protein
LWPISVVFLLEAVEYLDFVGILSVISLFTADVCMLSSHGCTYNWLGDRFFIFVILQVMAIVEYDHTVVNQSRH